MGTGDGANKNNNENMDLAGGSSSVYTHWIRAESPGRPIIAVSCKFGSGTLGGTCAHIRKNWSTRATVWSIFRGVHPETQNSRLGPRPILFFVQTFNIYSEASLNFNHCIELSHFIFIPDFL